MRGVEDFSPLSTLIGLPQRLAIGRVAA